MSLGNPYSFAVLIPAFPPDFAALTSGSIALLPFLRASADPEKPVCGCSHEFRSDRKPAPAKMPETRAAIRLTKSHGQVL